MLVPLSVITAILFILGLVIFRHGGSKTEVLPRGIYENVARDGRIWRAEYVEREQVTPTGRNFQCLGTLLILLSCVSCVISIVISLTMGLFQGFVLPLAPMVTVSADEQPFQAPKSVPVTDEKAVLHNGETWHKGVVFLTLEHVNYEASCSELLDFDLVVALANKGRKIYVPVTWDTIDVRDEHGRLYSVSANDGGFDPSCYRYSQDIKSLNFAVHSGYQRRLGVRVLSKPGPKPTMLTVTLKNIGDVNKARWSIPLP